MQRFPLSPHEMLASPWRHRALVFALAKREVVGRYRGSVLGLAWSFFNPLLMLAVYTFIFSVVFKARWGLPGQESGADFALILFVGLILHGVFAECVNRAPGLILGNVSYVKKIVFPLEILPWVALGSALFHAAISFAVLLLAQLFLQQQLPWTVILLPLVLLPLVLGTLGMAWFLSALGVYIRDIAQLTGLLTTALLFVSAVFFPVSALPPSYQFWVRLNPLAYVIEQGREVLVFGRSPDMAGLALTTLAGGLLAWAGFGWFQKTRRGFADVL